MENIKTRLKSTVVWVAIVAQIIVIVGLFYPDIADYIKIIGACIIEIATVVGILNNPTDVEKF